MTHLWDQRKGCIPEEINQLSVMLRDYLHDSGFFDKTRRINWLSLEAYKDKETGEPFGPQQSFAMKYAQDITQQQSHCLLVL